MKRSRSPNSDLIVGQATAQADGPVASQLLQASAELNRRRYANSLAGFHIEYWAAQGRTAPLLPWSSAAEVATADNIETLMNSERRQRFEATICQDKIVAFHERVAFYRECGLLKQDVMHWMDCPMGGQHALYTVFDDVEEPFIFTIGNWLLYDVPEVVLFLDCAPIDGGRDVATLLNALVAKLQTNPNSVTPRKTIAADIWGPRFRASFREADSSYIRIASDVDRGRLGMMTWFYKNFQDRDIQDVPVLAMNLQLGQHSHDAAATVPYEAPANVVAIEHGFVKEKPRLGPGMSGGELLVQMMLGHIDEPTKLRIIEEIGGSTEVSIQSFERAPAVLSSVKLSALLQTQRAPLSLLAGVWKAQDGSLVQVAEDQVMMFIGGSVASLQDEGGARISMACDGEIINRATLSDGKLSWDDGEVWTFIRRGPRLPLERLAQVALRHRRLDNLRLLVKEGAQLGTCGDLEPLRPQLIMGDADTWATFGARALITDKGKLYHEVVFHDDFEEDEDEGPQVGWANDAFKMCEEECGEGVGDDCVSWGYDGVRHKMWHGIGRDCVFPHTWKAGDVVGLAIDMGEGLMACSLNGDWLPQAEFRFDTTVGHRMFPALSANGSFTMHITKDCWTFAPPSSDFTPWSETGLFFRPIGNERRSMLMEAVQCGLEDVVDLLLELRAPLTDADHEGWTALGIAAHAHVHGNLQGAQRILNRLWDAGARQM